MKKLKNEYFKIVEYMIEQFPNGRYHKEYEKLQNYEFEG
jgi:hypothetical protein